MRLFPGKVYQPLASIISCNPPVPLCEVVLPMLQIGVGGAEVTWLAHRAEISVLIPKLGRRVTSPFRVAQNCGYGGILGVEWHRQKGGTWGIRSVEIPGPCLAFVSYCDFCPCCHSEWARLGHLSGPSSSDGLEFQAGVPGPGDACALERGSAKQRQI